MKQILKTLIKDNVSPQAYKTITKLVDTATSTWRLATRPFNGQRSRQDLFHSLEIIFSGFPNAVVMVDDFHVPFDSGYGYDDYGAGRSLTAAYIEPIVAAHGLRAFYPSTPSAHETGARRGCVILAKKYHTGTVLASLPLLQEAQPPSGSEK